MTITISDQTRSIIESRMKELGFDDADALVRAAVERFVVDDSVDYEALDAETRAAIEEADSQEGLPWEQVREELKQKFGLQ